ncbi:MAG: hypothetical protein KGJ02_08495 [Verrucomicrobiota bacterium]|nr:hypothetical protein [Verrucomicrobiota bacterium]
MNDGELSINLYFYNLVTDERQRGSHEIVQSRVVRLGLLLFSFFALPPSVLMVKAAWRENNHKKMRLGISLLWSGILAGFIFLKMFGGMK